MIALDDTILRAASLALEVGDVLPFGPALWDMALRLLLAAVSGALIGWERDRADKPVDARTMMLVALGAAAFTLLGERVLIDSMAGNAESVVRLDPTRVLAYVISGVGFLGAGAILHSKRTVSGLTTASSVWCTAAVGCAFGLGDYALGMLTFLIVFITLWGSWLFNKPKPTNGKG